MTTKMEKKMIGAFYTLTEENIELHKQIATLKAALIRERERYLDDFIHQDSPCEDRTVEAISQLAHWRPELFSASEIDAVIEKTQGVSHDNRRRSPIHGAN